LQASLTGGGVGVTGVGVVSSFWHPAKTIANNATVNILFISLVL
jgi:hypothetical protein